MITNWAQGDVMTFDIELDARQLTAPAPGGEEMTTLSLVEKDSITWEPVANGANGVLTFKTAAEVFEYTFSATGLNASTDYSLIYYADPWPGNNPGKLIVSGTTDGNGGLAMSGIPDLMMDLPDSNDANYPVGAKVWLVPTSNLTGDQLSWTNLGQFLFDLTMVNYDDTDL